MYLHLIAAWHHLNLPLKPISRLFCASILAAELGKEEIQFQLLHSPGWGMGQSRLSHQDAHAKPKQVNLLIGDNLFGLLCVLKK